MKKNSSLSSIPFWVLLLVGFCVSFSVHVNSVGSGTGSDDQEIATVVKKNERRSILSTEYGQISAVKVSDGKGGTYHLQFIILEPNALFLPVLLHADMVFYVQTGRARLSWADYEGGRDELQHADLRRGDVYRLHPGTFFFIQSSLEPDRQKLRIFAMFTYSKENLQEHPSIGVYSSIHDLVVGFDDKVLQAAFNVPEEVIAELKSGAPQPLIVHGVPKSKKMMWEVEAQFMKSLFGSRNYGMFDFNGKKDITKTFNILKARPDVENCNGWSLSVTRKQLKALKHSDIGVFMVNLTTGAMMGPHWNPMATEIAVVLQGRGMIRVVCSSTADEECKNMRLKVEEGDVFVVPRFHPMTQISFNNESFVFMGFATASRTNHPQFLAGKRSVLQTLDKLVLAVSFEVSNRTIEQLLAPQDESIILECTSCAENEEALMEEEIEREREEIRRREKEEARRREEEKRREEEEARKREEEEAKKREEEKRRREEEEEEAARKREEEEEEEAAKRREEEEAARKREEEEAKRREEEEEEAAKRRKEEEVEARRREEEEARRREEERAREREEEERRREEEEEAARREEERRRQEAGQEEEEARRQEEERERQQEEEEERERQQEEERERQQEEERERQKEEEEERERQQEEERERRKEGEEGRREREPEEQEGEEAARREDEERERAREEEAAARERESEGQEEQEGEARRDLRKMRNI